MLNDAPVSTCYWCPDFVPRRQINACREYASWVHMAQLVPERKRQLWRGIQAAAPALAELIQDDFVQALKRDFGAVQMMDTQQFDELINRGEQK